MKKKVNNKQAFLETFFDGQKEYAEKEVNGFWLVRYKNGNTWPIAIYTPKKMANYKAQSRLFD